MRNRYFKILAVLIIAVTCFSGCLWAPDLERLKNEIQAQIPEAQFNKEVAMTFGPVTLGLASIVTRFIPEAQEARGYLKDVRRLELAVYETEYLPSLDNLRLPAKLEAMRDKENWQVAAKIREKDQFVWVLYHEKGDKIDSLFVFILDDENFVLARIKGNFENMALRGIQDSKILKEG
jgi:hypothetical protein